MRELAIGAAAVVTFTFLLILAVEAQQSPASEAILEEETITSQDLGVREPTLLPSSPFYFLKNFTAGLQRVFTFNPVRRVELELRFADEKLAEAKKLAQTSPENVRSLDRAIENYRLAQERLRSRLSSLRETSQNPNVERLLEKLADRAVKHEKLLAELKEKFEDRANIEKKIEVVAEALAENVAEASKKDDAQNFARKLEKALAASPGSDFRHFRSLEFIDGIAEKADEKLREVLAETHRDFLTRLKEELAAGVASTTPGIIPEVLERLPGDRARRLVTLEELGAEAERRFRASLEEAKQDLLEKVSREVGELAEHAQEQIRHARERVEKLEAAVKEETSVPQAVLSLGRQAREHLNQAIGAFDAKRYGEAFGQARTAEVIARNALHILEAEHPEGEDLKEDIAELGEELKEWEERVAGLDERYRPKAREALERSRGALRLAEESLVRGALREAKRHLEEAKGFLRLLERIVKELSRGVRAPELAPVPFKPREAVAPGTLPRCEELKRSLSELDELLRAGRIRPEDYKAKYETVRRELAACLTGLTAPVPLPEPQPIEVVCTQEYAPVCGTDGKTYSNACHAKVAGSPIAYNGECGTQMKTLESPTLAPTASIAEFKVEADDAGFYPSNVISVPRGAKVRIYFLVRQDRVYYGGLDFRSSKFKTETVKPGGSTSVEFTADESFTVTSYWPLSGVMKSTLRVEVK